MDGWKKGKPYAMVVCPIYQLPVRQVRFINRLSPEMFAFYIFSFISFGKLCNRRRTAEAEKLLFEIFKVIPALNPSKMQLILVDNQ